MLASKNCCVIQLASDREAGIVTATRVGGEPNAVLQYGWRAQTQLVPLGLRRVGRGNDAYFSPRM
jgi:hypothetical protein